MSSNSKAKSIHNSDNDPEKSMEDPVWQISDLMRVRVSEDLRDNLTRPADLKAENTSQKQTPKKTLADVYRGAGSALTLQNEEQTWHRPTGEHS